FSLADRGVVPGSTITQLVLVIEEGRPGPEFPSFNATEKLIQACKITNFWPPGEAELWETIPPFEEGACAEGTRQEGETPDQPTTWTFDLTALAAEWGTDPFANNGVMLVGVPGAGGPQDSWQINLKIPARDDVATPNNEYDDTQARTYVLLQFQPGAPADVGSTPVSPVGGSTGGGTTTLNGDPLGGSTAGGAGSGDAGAGTGFDSTAGGDAGGNQEQPPLIPLAGPRFPWYVWLLIPVALAASAAVRAALLEAAPGGRPDGVIAAIRRRGAELRGEAGPQGS
ncbi:MAG: hypothetical protein HY658_04465, partial [Actinobacteria bacterium]|nr:hypothetical protein [Actinomycetota bacterium]